MNNSPWLQVKQEDDQFSNLYLSFGAKNTLLRLRNEQVDLVCKRLIVDSIRRYINHRKRIIFKYGGHKTPKALTALNQLNYAFNGSTNRWSLEALPRIIKNWEAQLLEIAPKPNSKYYKNQTQFLISLTAWANHEMSIHHGAK